MRGLAHLVSHRRSKMKEFFKLCFENYAIFSCEFPSVHNKCGLELVNKSDGVPEYPRNYLVPPMSDTISQKQEFLVWNGSNLENL